MACGSALGRKVSKDIDGKMMTLLPFPSSILRVLVILCGCAWTMKAQVAEDQKPAIEEVSPGVLRIGTVQVEQATKTVSFPAAVNMTKGLMEYLLVGRGGPTHESLLVTDTKPIELHTAMLLLGAKGSKPTPGGAEVPPPQLTKEYLQHAPKLTGDLILLTATWKDANGNEKTGDISQWLLYTPSKKPPVNGPWLYTGSGFGADGAFLAQVEDILAGLVTNSAALINNPRKGNDDDRAWDANPAIIPPVKTPLTLSVKLLEQPGAAGSTAAGDTEKKKPKKKR